MFQTVKNFFAAVWDFIGSFFDYGKDLLLWVPKKLFADLGDALLSAWESIPAPSFIGQTDGLFAAIPGGVWWFASVAELKFGVTAIISGFLIRFLIRRLPVIG